MTSAPWPTTPPSESHAPLWSLWEYHLATGDDDALRAARRAAEFFLQHRLFRSEETGAVINGEWLKLHYPPYYHYGLPQGLRALRCMGALGDPLAREALDLVEAKRLADGHWPVEGCHWYPPGRRGSNVEVVEWGRRGPNEMVTLSALRVLRASGRLRWP